MTFFIPNVVRDLHARGIRVIYDTADIRHVFADGKGHDLYTDRAAWEKYYRPFVGSVDGLILANPRQQDVDDDQAIPRMKIALPLLNRHRRTRYAHAGPIRLIWQGYPENMPPMLRLHPILDRLRLDTGLDIRLVYNTKGAARREGPIEYTQWNVHRWDRVLAEADIAVAIKPLDDPYQQRKPATKVISYMAAALPVVCTPSQADRQVIHHGKTGFFAYNDQEWYDYLHALIQDPSLRSRIGNAARRQVIEAYGDKQVAAEYEDLFERVLANRPMPG
ncbi:glycosyltransferase [Synechococcus sp. GFB01]|uniref:glycosyltransferase n=1 Tax=Synechococcus sp. GFB01 TaxID=1662190 RepID=UPI00128D808B|nr:glycosyltransferase [Synechococcus sp. GFB01]